MSGPIAATDEAIIERAPGKLFIAGEYAVVSPGEPAVLVAVDRFLTVRLTESADAGSIHSPEYGRIPVVWTRGEGGLTLDQDHHPYDYVFAAITIADRLRAERGLAPRFFDLRIDSGLDDVSGRKFGLGSSAAVTVATLRAIDRFFGFALSATELFQLALLATIRVAPSASGGDLAASTFGGWIGYRSPDRDLLRRRADESVESLLADADAWAGFEVRRLSAPRDLSFLVGWTGAPASTEKLVDAVGRGSRAGALRDPAFLDLSRRCVDGLWASLASGDDDATIAGVRAARRILRDLGAQSGVVIETPALSALCDAAEAIGAAAKPSGAGGGDCGIVLAPAGADVAQLLRTWEAHDIRHLTVSVHAHEADAT